MTNRIISIIKSVKEDEKRLPIHPYHLDEVVNNNFKLHLQNNYTNEFGDYDLNTIGKKFLVSSRKQLLSESDVIFLLKPSAFDISKMKKHATLIGWCHAVQNIELSKTAQQKNITLIAMEEMYINDVNGDKVHLFRENNYIAGSVGVAHALSCVPIDYKRGEPVSIITYGAVSQGAVLKLAELGFTNITVYSRRLATDIKNKVCDVDYQTFFRKGNVLLTKSGHDLRQNLLNSSIIVNGIMQNPLDPYMFLYEKDLNNLSGRLIIDISCDYRVGFDFARATSINKPIVKINNNFYYAVDNIPSLVWQDATLSISQSLLPIVNSYLTNSFSHELENMINCSIEIKNGIIINKKIYGYKEKNMASIVD